MRDIDFYKGEQTKKILWGTYGGKHRRWFPYGKRVPLGWCTTSHLQAIASEKGTASEIKEGIDHIIAQRSKQLFFIRWVMAMYHALRRSLLPRVLMDAGYLLHLSEMQMIRDTPLKELPLLMSYNWYFEKSKEAYHARFGR